MTLRSVHYLTGKYQLIRPGGGSGGSRATAGADGAVPEVAVLSGAGVRGAGQGTPPVAFHLCAAAGGDRPGFPPLTAAGSLCRGLRGGLGGWGKRGELGSTTGSGFPPAFPTLRQAPRWGRTALPRSRSRPRQV